MKHYRDGDHIDVGFPDYHDGQEHANLHTSIAGLRGDRAVGHYGSTKRSALVAALRALADQIECELNGDRITSQGAVYICKNPAHPSTPRRTVQEVD